MAKPPIPEDVVELLKRPNPAVMAAVRPDGSPITVATWYLWEDGRILLNLDAGRRRLDYMRADPRVSLTVLDGDSWYRHVTVQGKVTLQDDPDLSIIDRIAQHYNGAPYPDRGGARVSAWLAIDAYQIWG